MESRAKIIERARKLLALADRNANEHEAALAASKAQALLAEHDLTIECVDVEEAATGGIHEEAVDTKRRMPSWRRTLLHGVTKANGCSSLICRNYYENTVLSIVGAEADIILARSSYEYLCEVVDRLARKQAHGMGRSYAASFRLGCATRLSVRVRAEARRYREALEAQGRVTSTGRALVVCKERELAQHMSQYGTSTFRGSVGSSDGYRAGQAAADGVGLSRQVEGAARPALGGA